MTTFSMQCPVCDGEVEDIEGTYIECRGREEFWGAPVVTDESEFAVEHIPECPDCGKVTLENQQIHDFFWTREVVNYV